MAYVEKKITVQVDQDDIVNILETYISGDPDTLSEILVKMTNDQSLHDYAFSVVYDANMNISFISHN